MKMYLKEIFKQNKLDYSVLSQFKAKETREVEILSEEEYRGIKEWLQNYSLGCTIIPVFTNNESDAICVFADGILKGKVFILNHGEGYFMPRFENLESFISKINSVNGDWHNLPDYAFDYPIKNESHIEETILSELWQLIHQNKFISESHRELIFQTILYLTPPSKLETLLDFLKDKNYNIAEQAAWLVGVFHTYEPAQALIAELVKTKYKNHYLRNQFYEGEFKKKGFWRNLFDKIH
ncbi:hypothetical protein V9L05_15060 [Bernardetia sp. Wsw4-3y2]|uniref:hypothetical protein n=1 Tax=Bernardetia sp. Wsw4-3y2 TaxID=3127471 RepID=UPI0030CAE7D1